MKDFIRLVNRWVILSAGVLALLVIGVGIIVAGATRPDPQPPGVVSAVITYIPAPTYTPSSTSTPQPIPTSTPTEDGEPPPPPPGEILPGAYVQITGTGGDGLRMRTEPGLNAQIRYLGIEAEVFLVQEGPREVDGFIWWLLTAPADVSRQGWVVSNYLAVVQNP